MLAGVEGCVGVSTVDRKLLKGTDKALLGTPTGHPAPEWASRAGEGLVRVWTGTGRQLLSLLETKGGFIQYPCFC